MSIFSFFCAPATKEEEFWKWFQTNEARLFDFEKDQARIFSELTKELNKIDPNLTFEFGPDNNGKRDFVISADGIKSAFPAVISLADKAPNLPRWTIIKFRPRREMGNEMTMTRDGVLVRVDQITFTIEPDGDKAAITLYIDGYDSARHNTFGTIGFLLLDTALGEYNIETKVGAIDFKPASAPSKLPKTPFKDLPEIFDRFMAAKTN